MKEERPALCLGKGIMINLATKGLDSTNFLSFHCLYGIGDTFSCVFCPDLAFMLCFSLQVLMLGRLFTLRRFSMRLFPSLVLAAALFCSALAGPASAQDFLKGGINMGNTGCSDAVYACADVVNLQQEILDKSNQCIKENFSIKEPIMSHFSMSGEYENCVLPSRVYKTASERNVWAVCCLKKIEGSENCNLTCTHFITPK